MDQIKLGIIREGKVPPDKRVPLTPKHCKEILSKYPHVKIFVQPSPVRAILDSEYENVGIELKEDLSDCDILIGVKEVNKPDLLPNKKYMFFSHTFKEQPYNRALLQEVLDKKIQLIDYEVMTNTRGTRIIGFGRYAGIVGCYNGFLTYGKKHNLYNLKPANQCEDRVEMESELSKVELPKDAKIVLTGWGRVGNGAREIIQKIGLKEVSANEFLSNSFDQPVFTQLKVNEYNETKDGSEFNKSAFYEDASDYRSTFMDYLKVSNMYIACHYWDASAPFIFTREDLKNPEIKTTVVADISCDIDGPVASTLRPSTIADPIYGYNVTTESEDDFMKEGVIAVMAVDNLPCELPKDASQDFGDELIKNIFDSLFIEDKDKIIERASETDLNGKLMPNYAYLESYLQGVES
jgi:alanine dehydrogenase